MTPGPYPDCKVWDHDFLDDRRPAWDCNISNPTNGFPLDLSASALWAPVLDNGIEVGQLLIIRDEDQEGHLIFQLTKEVFDKLGRYSTWRLHESPIFDGALLEGRIVKNS